MPEKLKRHRRPDDIQECGCFGGKKKRAFFLSEKTEHLVVSQIEFESVDRDRLHVRDVYPSKHLLMILIWSITRSRLEKYKQVSINAVLGIGSAPS